MCISNLTKGAEFVAKDTKNRTVRGKVLDVLPWSKWPLKCDCTVDGMRQITQFNTSELSFTNQ